MEQQSSNEVDALRAELEKMREEMSKLTSSDMQSTRDFAKEIQSELRNTLNQARDKGRDFLDQAKEGGDKAIGKLEKQIEERPLLTLLIVFIAGLLLAKLFERR